MLKKIANTQIFVALCASLLSAETFIITHREINWKVLLIVFLATLFIYNASQINVAFSAGEKSLKKSLNFEGTSYQLSVCSASTIILFFMLTGCDRNQVIIFMVAAFCSLLYMMPFKVNDQRIKGLRNNLVVKNILLSAIWALATVLFPLISHGVEVQGNEVIFMFLRRFFFIYALTIVYDIKDIEKDRLNGMKTIASRLGVNGTQLIATMSLTLFCFFIYLDHNLYQPEYQFLATALYSSAVFAFLTIMMSGSQRNNNYYSFVVDGSMAFQFLLVFFLNYIR
jgi:4-hydroxybenzoate polyprenyltransferase